jgi:hypothetical protein
MMNFDKQIIKIDGVYYYASYVDDIVIFYFKQENLTEKVKKFLPDNMELNTTYIQEAILSGSLNMPIYESKLVNII